MYINNSDVIVSICIQIIDDDIISIGESIRYLDYLIIESIFDVMFICYCCIGINNDCFVVVVIIVCYVIFKVDVILLCIIDSYCYFIFIYIVVYIGDGQVIRSC